MNSSDVDPDGWHQTCSPVVVLKQTAMRVLAGLTRCVSSCNVCFL